jgi:hypothetical protein
MKIVLALATALLVFAGASADAAWFGLGGNRLPKPIDTPRIRPKVREDHKVGKKQRHPDGWSSVLERAETARG